MHTCIKYRLHLEVLVLTVVDTILDNNWICNEQRIEFQNTLIGVLEDSMNESIPELLQTTFLQSNHRNPGHFLIPLEVV